MHALCGVALAAGCLLTGCAATVQLSSKVTAAGTDSVVVGARAKLLDSMEAVLDSTQTDPEGVFRFTLTRPYKGKPYLVVVDLPLLSEPHQVAVQLASDPPIPEWMELAVRGGIWGVVRGRGDSTLSDAQVTLMRGDDSLDQQLTLPNGSFAFGSLEPGDYLLQITSSNYYTGRTSPFSIARGQILSFEGEGALNLRRIPDGSGRSWEEIVQSGDWEAINTTGVYEPSRLTKY